MIDWTKPESLVTEHFTVREMLYLPSWGRLATEADGLDDTIKSNLRRLAASLESVRAFLGVSIHVHVTYRPKAYNALIGGAPNSSHVKGLACDFDCPGLTCDEVRQKILDNKLLDALDMYMEDGMGTNWVHLNLDDGVARRQRFFKP